MSSKIYRPYLSINHYILVVFTLCFNTKSIGQSLPDIYQYTVDKFENRQSFFNKNLLGFVFDKNGLAWMGNDDGLFIFDGNKAYAANDYLQAKNKLLKNQVTAIFYNENDNTLIVFSFDLKTTYIYIVFLNKLGTKLENQAIKLIFKITGPIQCRPIYKENQLSFINSNKLVLLHLDDYKVNKKWISSKLLNNLVYLKGEGYMVNNNGSNNVFQVLIQNDSLKFIFKNHLDYSEINKMFKLRSLNCSNNKYIKNSSLTKLCSFEPIARKIGLNTQIFYAIDIIQDKLGNYYLYGGLGFQKISYARKYIFPMPTAEAETRAVWYNSIQGNGLVATSHGIRNFSLNPPKVKRFPISGTPNHYYNVLSIKDTSLLFFPLYPEVSPSRPVIINYNTQNGNIKIIKISVSPQISRLTKTNTLEIQSSIKDSNGTLLLGTNFGLCTTKITKDSIHILPTGIHNGDVINNIIPAHIKDHLILATNSGLFDVDLITKREKLLYRGSFLSLVLYKSGWIAGSRGLGVLFFNKNNEFISQINTEKGLPDNTVYSIAYDAKFHIAWLGTGNGLVPYHIIMGILKTYTTADGITSNEFNRNSSLFLTKDNIILMGGIKGLTAIRNREPFCTDTSAIKPTVWGFSVVDKNDNYKNYFINLKSDNELLNSLPNGLKKIIIKTACYTSQNQLYKTAYKVDDDKWKYLNPNDDLELISINPGEHTVLIKAVTVEMKESEPVEIKFKIEQTWYLSIWGMLTLVLLGVIIMLPITYARTKYIRVMADTEINKNREKFFAIIAHDLRSPIKVYQNINEVIDSLIQKKDWERLKKVGTEIDATSRKLDLMVENLLSWSLLQQKQLIPTFQFINFEFILLDIMPIYRKMAQNKDLHLIVNIKIDELIFTDSNLLSLIVRNMLDNSIKNAPAVSEVYFEVKIINHKLILIFYNNFEIYKQQDLIKLAEHFTNSRLDFNKGLGLKFIEQAIALLKGEINIKIDISTNLIVWEISIPCFPSEF